MSSRRGDEAPDSNYREIFRRFARLGVALPLLTFALITLGGIVRTTGAGLACPDWPLCHGRLLPLADPLVLTEWTHRLVAGTLGLLILAQLGWILYQPVLRRRLGGLGGLALGLYVSQAILGGLTVLNLLAPGIVNLHLANGLALFVVLLLVALRSVRLADDGSEVGGRASEDPSGLSGPGSKPAGSPDLRPPPPALYRLALATAFIVYVQAVLGGGVSSNGAGLACPDFPTCHGMWFPPLVGMVGLQVFHRWGALVAFAAVMWLQIAAIRGPLQARMASRLAAALMVIQVLLGVANVHAGLTVPLSAAHLANAAGILALVVVTAYAARPRGMAAPESIRRAWQEAATA